MKTLRRLAVLVVIALLAAAPALVLSGCKEESPASRMEDQIEEAGEEAEDMAEDAADAAEEAANDAERAAEDAMD